METIKRKNGSVKYRAKVYINNKPISKLFDRKADADKWKRMKLNEKEQIEVFGAPLVKTITLLNFSKIWFENKPELARSSVKSYRSALSCYLIPSFGNLLLKDIRIDNAQKLMSELRERKLSPSRMKLVVGVLTHLLNDAVRWEYLLHHPLKNLSKIKVPASPQVYWLHHEIRAFLNANKDDEHYALYVTAMNTGMRISELLGLQWNKVDFTKDQIVVSCQRNRHGIINKTKNGNDNNVPMNEVLKRVLSALKQEARSLDYVFMKKNGEMINPEHFSERIFKQAILRAKVKVICFRNLRTSFAANYCMSGGDLYAVSKILNHASPDFTAKKYAHLHPSYLKKAIESVSFEADTEDNSSRLAHTHLRVMQSN